MKYTIGGMVVTPYLEHHGIIGQKWGVRRFQNEDGSLTEAGKARYGYGSESSNSNYKDPKQLKKAQEGYAKAFKEKYADIHNAAADRWNEGMVDKFNENFNFSTMTLKEAEEYEYAFNRVTDYLISKETLRILGDMPGSQSEALMEEGRQYLKKYGLKL